MGLKNAVCRQEKSKTQSLLIALAILVLVQTVQLGIGAGSFLGLLNKIFINWLNILLNNSYTGIIALGMTLVIISGGIDLAVGSSLVAVGAFVMSLLSIKESGLLLGAGITGVPAILLGVALGLVFGALLGLLNGVFIADMRVPPFIVTLASMQIFRSLTQYLMKGQPGAALPEGFKQIARLKVAGNMFMPIVYWALLALLLNFIMKRTELGRNIYAIGSNERAAELAGVNSRRTKRIIYCIMGVLVAVSSIVQISRLGSMDFANAGSGYEMNAIAAVIIGGTSMSGGRGSILGTILGTLILAIVNNLLTLLGVDPFLRDAFRGAIVLSAVVLQQGHGINKWFATFKRRKL